MRSQPSMTRQHFEAIAKTLGETAAIANLTQEQCWTLAGAMASTLGRFNYSFDFNKFREATIKVFREVADV